MEDQIKKFLILLRELQKIDPEFPLQYAICLGEIALDEGMSLTSLSRCTGMPLPTVSRIVGALSRRRQKGVAYGLIRVAIAKQERRRKELYLAPRGRMVVKSVEDIMAA